MGYGSGAFDEGFADLLLASLVRDPEIEMFQAQMVLEAPRRPEVKILIDRLYASYISTIESALRSRGVDTSEGEHEELARMVFATLNGLVLQFLSVGSTEPIKKAILELGRLLESVFPAKLAPRS